MTITRNIITCLLVLCICSYAPTQRVNYGGFKQTIVTYTSISETLYLHKDSVKTRLHTIAIKLQTEIYHTKKFSHNKFLNKLAYRESSNNWKAMNRFGYMGKYQFGGIAFKDVGMSPIDTTEFRTHPEIFPESTQDSIVEILIDNNLKYLRRYIPRYENTIVNGIKITRSGLIGAAHLVGNGNVKKWLKLKGDILIIDGNGVSIEEYLVLFANYKV